MKYVITKLFRQDEDGVVSGANIVLHREGGQMRRITSKIGGPREEGHYVLELRGSDRNVNIDMDANTTLHIEPVRE